MAKIPRGVADQDIQVAVVHDRRGALVAVNLASGAVVWRGGMNLRPCLIVGETVVAVRVGARNTLSVVTLRLDDGSEVSSTSPIALPDWVRPALDDMPEFELSADTDGHEVALHWVARATYRGGAAAGEGVLADQAREAAGVVRMNLADSLVRSASEPPREHGTQPVAPTGRDRKPGVVDYADMGDLMLELVISHRAGADAVSLRAVEPGSEAHRWEVLLDDAVERRARKLRP
jgi:hypothetical protein